MSKPSAQEYAAAQVLGAQCRRSGGKRTHNPYQFSNAEPARILSDAWDAGWLIEDGRRA